MNPMGESRASVFFLCVFCDCEAEGFLTLAVCQKHFRNFYKADAQTYRGPFELESVKVRPTRECVVEVSRVLQMCGQT